MNLVVSPEATADLDRLFHFLANVSPRAAARAAAALDDAIQSLIVFPGRGRPVETAGVRELIVPFGRSAYLLRYAYSAETETVMILRIWHGREGG